MPRFEIWLGRWRLVVEGIYRGMLEREREKCAEVIPRRVDDPGTGCFVRPRVLLTALEAAGHVVVRRPAVELQMHFLSGGRQKLPWDRSVKSVGVSPDDIVRPTDEQHPWYGRRPQRHVERIPWP